MFINERLQSGEREHREKLYPMRPESLDNTMQMVQGELCILTCYATTAIDFGALCAWVLVFVNLCCTTVELFSAHVAVGEQAWKNGYFWCGRNRTVCVWL